MSSSATKAAVERRGSIVRGDRSDRPGRGGTDTHHQCRSSTRPHSLKPSLPAFFSSSSSVSAFSSSDSLRATNSASTRSGVSCVFVVGRGHPCAWHALGYRHRFKWIVSQNDLPLDPSHRPRPRSRRARAAAPPAAARPPPSPPAQTRAGTQLAQVKNGGFPEVFVYMCMCVTTLSSKTYLGGRGQDLAGQHGEGEEVRGLLRLGRQHPAARDSFDVCGERSVWCRGQVKHEQAKAGTLRRDSQAKPTT